MIAWLLAMVCERKGHKDARTMITADMSDEDHAVILYHIDCLRCGRVTQKTKQVPYIRRAKGESAS